MGLVLTLPATATAVMASGDDSWHVPGLEEFFPEPFLFQGSPFEINRIVMVRLIAVVLLVVVFGLYARRAKLVPGRAQSGVEYLM